jgi:hypothetical protein
MNYAMDDPELYLWLEGVQQGAAGHFLTYMVKAAYQADGDNARILHPVLRQLMEKYPKYMGAPDATHENVPFAGDDEDQDKEDGMAGILLQD